MRLRKQAKPAAQPGDEFLRAVSSRPTRSPKATGPQPAEDASDLRRQLFESERKAEAADEALRQMRGERDERLQQAREALARERAARMAAEDRLSDRAAQAPSGPPPSAQPGDPAPATPAPPPSEPMYPDQDRTPGPQEGASEADWPTPWLAEDGGRRRGLFRRLRS